MRFEQFRAIFRSLRFRLTAWNTTVVLLTVLLALVGVHEGLRLSLINEMDKSLLANAREISLAVEAVLSRSGQAPIKEMDRMVHGARGGRAVRAAPCARRRGPLGEQQHALARRACRCRPSTSLRCAASPAIGWRSGEFKNQGVPAYTVRVGSSLKPVDEDVAKLTGLTTYAGVVLLFLAPLGGYWLSGRATHPLARIITTAARLASQPHGRALADPRHRRRARQAVANDQPLSWT